MTRSLKLQLYAVVLLLVSTGLAYAIPAYMDRWFFIELDSPLSGHTLMMLHGLAAFIGLFMVGYLTRSHVGIHIRGPRHKKSGLTAFSMFILLAATGYLLYYVGDEEWRQLSGDIHVAIGLLMPVMLVAHRWRALRNRRSTTVSEVQMVNVVEPAFYQP